MKWQPKFQLWFVFGVPSCFTDLGMEVVCMTLAIPKCARTSEHAKSQTPSCSLLYPHMAWFSLVWVFLLFIKLSLLLTGTGKLLGVRVGVKYCEIHLRQWVGTLYELDQVLKSLQKRGPPKLGCQGNPLGYT